MNKMKKFHNFESMNEQEQCTEEKYISLYFERTRNDFSFLNDMLSKEEDYEKISDDIADLYEQFYTIYEKYKNLTKDIVVDIDDDFKLTEKWKGDIKVKHTGEHEDKSIDDLEEELSELKKRSKKIQEKGEKVPRSIVDQEQEINFAIRAKKHWK